MGLFGFSLIRTGKLKLTAHDRQQIVRLFGSFDANKLGQTNAAFLNEGYEENVDVFSIINKISDTRKAVPWVVEEELPNGDIVLLEDTTIHELMENPNPSKGFTWDDIEEMINIYILATGNSYMVGNTQINKTLIEELEILPPFAITPTASQDFFLPDIKYLFELGTTKRNFDNSDIEHIKYFNPAYVSIEDSVTGLSPIQVAARVVQSGNDKWEASAHINQNRGTFGLITDKSDRPMTPEESDYVQQGFDGRTGGPHKQGKVTVTNKNLDFIQMAMSPTDLKLIEQGVIGLRAICNVYRVNSSLFNDPENKKFSNVLEAEKELYTDAVIPLSKKIAAQHTTFIAKNHFPDRKVSMRQDFSKVEALQKDKKVEAEKDKIVVEGLDKIIRMPIEDTSKIQLIQEIYDLPEEVVKAIITNVENGTIPNNQEPFVRD